MRDERLNKLADGLVNYSVHLQKGEKIFIEAFLQMMRFMKYVN